MLGFICRSQNNSNYLEHNPVKRIGGWQYDPEPTVASSSILFVDEMAVILIGLQEPHKRKPLYRRWRLESPALKEPDEGSTGESGWEIPFPPLVSLWHPLVTRLNIVASGEESICKAHLHHHRAGRVDLELRGNDLITYTSIKFRRLQTYYYS